MKVGEEEIVRIAVLDGVMWFTKPYVKMFRELKEGGRRTGLELTTA